MKASQKNRQARNLRVKSCVERTEIAPVLAAIPEYPGLKTKLDEHVEKLKTLESKQFSQLRILNTERRNWRQKTIRTSMQLVPALMALGSKIENCALLLEAGVSKTSLTRLRQPDLLAKSKALLAMSRTYSPDLLVYLISPEFLDSFEATCNSFDAAMKASQMASKEQKQVTSDILITLKAVDVVLGRIALVVETLKDANPVFFAIFRNAFHVTHTGGSVLSASGYVVDDDSSEVIKKCRLKFTGFQPLEEPPSAADSAFTGKAKIVTEPQRIDIPVKFTSRNGGFRYMNLPDGTYELTSFLAGYVEQRVVVYVNRGLHAKLHIRMRKVGMEAA
jgi:hypothetical protein